MPAAFDAMLAQLAEKVASGGRVTLTVSDSVAAIVSLPWQGELKRPAEIDAYAQACFERVGQHLNDRWAMRSYFRHYRAMGLAYAFPVAWLDALIDIVRSRGMHLESVLPVSAAAFGRHRRPAAQGAGVVILREANRTSALVYGEAGLADYASEPATHNRPDSTTRLLRRLGAAHEISSIADWAPHSSDREDWAELVRGCLPKAAYIRLGRDVWS